MSLEQELSYCKYILSTQDADSIMQAAPGVFRSHVPRSILVWAQQTLASGQWPSEQLLFSVAGEHLEVFKAALDCLLPANHKAIIDELAEAKKRSDAVEALHKAMADAREGNFIGIASQVNELVASNVPKWETRDFAAVVRDIKAGIPLREIRDDVNYLHTGIRGIDQVLASGPRTYGALCAMPGVGKTSLLFQAAVVSASQGIKTLAISLETDRDVLEAKCGATLVKARGGSQYVNTLLRKGAKAEYLPVNLTFEEDRLQIAYHPAGLPWEQLEAMIRSKASKGYKLFLLDYFALVEPAQIRGKGEYSLYAEMSKGLKVLAGETKTAIVVVVQPNAEVDYDIKPSPKNMSVTKQIFRDYDYGLFLWGADEETTQEWRRQGLQQATHLIPPKDPGRINRRLLHCWLHKNRVFSGESGNPEPTVFVDADIAMNWFTEADYQPPPEVGDANPNKPGRGRKR